jgi:hypothetical protein
MPKVVNRTVMRAFVVENRKNTARYLRSACITLIRVSHRTWHCDKPRNAEANHRGATSPQRKRDASQRGEVERHGSTHITCQE